MRSKRLNQIEDVLRGIGRMRILKLLAYEKDGLTVYRITKHTGISHDWVLKHFMVLEKEQLLTKKVFGKKRLLMFAESPRAEQLRDFLLNYCERKPRGAMAK